MQRLPVLKIAGAVVAMLLILIGVRTALLSAAPYHAATVSLPAAPPINDQAVAEHIAAAIRFPTISTGEPIIDHAPWRQLQDWLAATYPLTHAHLTRRFVADYSLVYEWRGSQANLPPIVLMAHQDVVPVDPGTLSKWRHPPFAGAIENGVIYGRGSIDDKGSLIALFDAVEALIRSGFHPKRTVYLVSGHDEEADGSGAQAVAAWFAANHIRPDWVLDEGGVTLLDPPLSHKPIAIINVAEKGYATIKLDAYGAGGHSSAPPEKTAVLSLAEAVDAVASHPFPMTLKKPSSTLFERMGADAPLPTRVIIANPDIFGPLLMAGLKDAPATAAMMHTTIAPTMLKGSPKDNVLPQVAEARINFRLAPGDSSAFVLERVRKDVQRFGVQANFASPPQEASRVSSTRSLGYQLISALAEADTHARAAPGLSIGATDAHSFDGVAQDVYRYSPFTLTLADFGGVHGLNEHLSVANAGQAARFFAQAIALGAGQ